jgi:hypothetical protein
MTTSRLTARHRLAAAATLAAGPALTACQPPPPTTDSAITAAMDSALDEPAQAA